MDRSQLPGPGDLQSAARRRAAAEGWSAPILTLARKATGNLSASFGSALRAAEGLGGSDGAEGGARAGRSGGGAPGAPVARRGLREPGGQGRVRGGVKSRRVPPADWPCFPCAAWSRPAERVGWGRRVLSSATGVPWITSWFSLGNLRKLYKFELRLSL